MICPRCKEAVIKVIYYGLPGKLCLNEECHTFFGFAAWLTSWLPFNGMFMFYTGSYWPALWHWLFGEIE